MFKLNESDNWKCLLYNDIKGFEYEEGYEYHLFVEVTTIKNPVADQYPYTYRLLKVISKTKKEE